MSAEDLPSLLTALQKEAKLGTHQVREALFLSFTTDLGFFEKQVLGTVRATGAAVTVVTDPRCYAPDPRAVRSAGLRYAVGLPALRGIFHPKVMVLVGDERATVAIGSGNLTMSGWHLNDEMLTIAQGDRDRCPRVIRDLAEWLADLLACNVLGPTASAAVLRTSQALSSLVQQASDAGGPRALGNLHRDLLGQLPHEPVDELRLFAPFHDLSGDALAGLLSHCSPRTVRIALQERITVVDPLALRAVAEDLGVHLAFERLPDRIDEERRSPLRHGKLIEAVRAGEVVWTLTGSANLSRSALCMSVDKGGNCELAVLNRGGASLYPATTGMLEAEHLTRVTNGPGGLEEEAEASLQRDHLLEAVLDGDVLRLILHRPHDHQRAVEVSTWSETPEQFTVIGVIPAGEAQIEFAVPPSWDGLLRLRIMDETGSGPTHFVTHRTEVLSRASSTTVKRALTMAPEDLFLNYAQAEAWMRSVTEVAAQLAKAPRTVALSSRTTASAQSGTHAGAVWDDPVLWDDYVRETIDLVGAPMASFILGGLPNLRSASESPRAAWEDDFTSQGDHADSEQDDDTDGAEVAARLPLGSDEKARYRRWLSRLVDQMAEQEGPADTDQRVRRVAASTVLLGTRLQIWDERQDAPWFDLLAKALARLSPSADGDDSTRALAQVMLYQLSVGARQLGSSDAASAYRQTEAAARHLLAPVTADRLAHFSSHLVDELGFTPDPELVAELAMAASTADPVAEALRTVALRHPSIEIEQIAPQVLQATWEDKTQIAAAHVLDLIPGDWAVVGIGGMHERVLYARAGDLLLTVTPRQQNRRMYRTYRLDALTSVHRIAKENTGAVEKPPLDRVPALGATVLAALDLTPETALTLLDD